ncbi:MAG: signal recognition particle-docking protein FtsY [Bdellovibrionales bacterium]|nr:signal recognition particle-docking protein FtsY [Bdellovibrionales bacterium]
MNQLDTSWIWVIGGAALVLGTISTIIYYFARYYFKTSEQDNEVVKSLKEIPPTQTVDERKVLQKEPENLKTPQPIKKELKDALFNTKQGLWGRIKDSFSGKSELNKDDFESLEEILYTSDLGPQTVQRLVEAISEDLDKSEKKDADKVRQALKNEMLNIFQSIQKEKQNLLEKVKNSHHPFVIMVVGVNGAGKTTTIGKLSNLFASAGLKTMLIAGDTFRAAAREQLDIWSQRADVEIFNPGNVQDPSAVAFDGCSSAKAKNVDVAIIDTAGRLHTQSNLMDELKKMKRVIAKVLPEAPQETLIVLDANSGQNALVQAKMFNEALELTGAVLTKLDGTAKGGVAVGLAYELELPIRLIGVGEGLDDLRNFESSEFVDSII